MGVPRRMPISTTRAPISKPRDDINDGKHARVLGSPLRDIQKIEISFQSCFILFSSFCAIRDIVKDAKCTMKRKVQTFA
jgi:hypothetical protein